MSRLRDLGLLILGVLYIGGSTVYTIVYVVMRNTCSSLSGHSPPPRCLPPTNLLDETLLVCTGGPLTSVGGLIYELLDHTCTHM